MHTLAELSDKFFEREIKKEKDDVDCLRRALKEFCKTGKKEDAFSVYFCFCELFEVFGSGYDTMSKLLEFLSDHEYHSGELLTKHRDHYSHSVYVFALGIAIYENDKTFNKIISDFYKKSLFRDTEFLYLWGLTALFHDIGYPFELAYRQVQSYTRELWGKEASVPYVSYENMGWLLDLNGKIKKENLFESVENVNELLAYGIHSRLGYPLHVLLKVLHNRYANQPKDMDHAYFSAVLLAHRLMQSEIALSDQILDVLTAIALHNSLNKFDLRQALGGASTAISPYKHPLAYLLILCDELQNWDRTAFGNVSKKDPLAWKVDLDISDASFKINYYFDSFKVVETKIDKEHDVDGLNETKVEIRNAERDNQNVTALQEDEFEGKLYKLIESHTTILAEAIEEPKKKGGKLFASSDKLVNLCDFATAIHASYQSIYHGPNFEDLPLEFKLSNIEQAKSYADKLELVNCFYSDRELDYPIVKGFSHEDFDEPGNGKKDVLGFLAREEHVRWVREKLDSGWKYGTDYKTREERNAQKIHRDIIPYDCLAQEEKEKDELMVKNMVPYLYEYGHGTRIYSYRTGLKPVLNIFGCGHRSISMDNSKLKEEVKAILREYQKDYRVIVSTCFACGADQLISQCAIELGITIKAVIPFEYEEYIEVIKEDAKKNNYKFTAEDELKMRHLIAQVVSLKVEKDPEYIYLEASKHIINKCQKMIVLWDGVESRLKDDKGNPINQGGTWHNICLARDSRGLKIGEDIHTIKCSR